MRSKRAFINIKIIYSNLIYNKLKESNAELSWKFNAVDNPKMVTN